MFQRTAFCGALLIALPATVSAQQSETPPGRLQLPPVTVITPKKAEPAKPKAKAGPKKTGPAQPVSDAAGAPAEGSPGGTGGGPAGVASKAASLNAAREYILPKIGVNSYELDQQTIAALPQGDNASLDKLLLQTPGVYQDSAASGNLHIRNEHANLQYRIDGIQLPDGVSGFGQVLETSLIANMTVVTGALPAQYGLRTAGLVDIQTRAGTPEPSGEVSIYGGSHDTFTSNIQYGGISGNTQYFFTGRFTENALGIENPTSSVNAIHDETQQEKFFSYVSTVLPNDARWTMITGASDGKYQNPEQPGAGGPIFHAGGLYFQFGAAQRAAAGTELLRHPCFSAIDRVRGLSVFIFHEI